MKKLFKSERGLKGLIMVLIVTMVALGGVSVSVFAEKGSNPNEGTKTTSKSTSSDETVYVLTDASGIESQRIVSESGTLHYEGYEDAQVPVTFQISYKLDGKEIAAEDLAGKSGHVVMNINYQNHIKSGGTYVPFMTITGMMLDNKYFSNVSVTNGKAIDDGNRNVVVGYALPGMQESLGVSELDIPSSVTVEADVENFQVETIYSIATNQVFQEMDMSKVNSLSDVKSQLSKLKSGVNELLDGTSTLYSGTKTLAVNTTKLASATDTLNTGAKQLYEGSKTLVAGTNKLTAGTDKLVTGANALSAGVTKLAGDAAKGEGVAYLSAAAQKLSGNSAAVNAGIQQVVDSSFASANNSLGDLGVPTLTEENYNTILKGMIDNPTYASVKAKLEQVLTSLTSIETLKTSVATYTGGVDQVAAGIKKVNDSIPTLETGANSLAGGIGLLRTSENDLVDGANTISTNLSKIYGGTSELAIKSGQLDAGVQKLNAGAKKLSEGVQSMSEQGLSKLSQLEESDLLDALDNIRAVGNASKTYNGFGGGSYDSVKFIYKTDGIAKEDK